MQTHTSAEAAPRAFSVTPRGWRERATDYDEECLARWRSLRREAAKPHVWCEMLVVVKHLVRDGNAQPPQGIEVISAAFDRVSKAAGQLLGAARPFGDVPSEVGDA
jgi:hypothetical protein